MKFKCLLLAVALSITGCLEIAAKPEVLDLSSELPDNHPSMPTPDATGNLNKSLLSNGVLAMGSRYFVASVLRNIFTDPSMTLANRTAFETMMDTAVLMYPAEFGGAPNLYSSRGLKEISGASCSVGCNNESMLDTPLQVASTPARAAVLATTCKKVLDNFIFLKEGMRKVDVVLTDSNAPAFDPAKTGAIYGLFYIGDDPPDEIKKAIYQTTQDAKFKGFSNLDQWRLAFSLVCESPYWQIL